MTFKVSRDQSPASRQPLWTRSLPSQNPTSALAVMTGLLLLDVSNAYADDTRTLAQIQSDIEQLKLQLTQDQEALATKAIGQGPSTESTLPSSASTQPESALDKVVVRRPPPIAQVADEPASISIVSGEELQELHADDLSSILRRAADVSWNQGNQRTNTVSIRGVGKIGITEQMDPSVGFTVDGVGYAYNAMTAFDFYDLQNISVDRGPQGTEGGKNANLGNINVTTRRPSFTSDFSWTVGYGSYETIIGEASGGGAIIPGLLAWRGALHIDKGPGDVKNVYSGQLDQTFQNTDLVGGRTEFLLTPTESLSVLLIGDLYPEAGENANGRTFFTQTPFFYSDGRANPLTTDAYTRLQRPWFKQLQNYSYGYNYLDHGQDSENNDAQGPQQQKTEGGSLEVDWTHGNSVLTSISAYRIYEFNAQNNDDQTPYSITTSGGVRNHYNQFSQELRLAGTIGTLADYTTGLYYMKDHSNYSNRSIYGADGGAFYASNAQYAALTGAADTGAGKYLLVNSLDSLETDTFQDITNKSTAAFAHINWHPTQALTLTTGARATYEDRINPGQAIIYNNGEGANLNPVSVNATNPVQTGGFASNATTGALLANNNASQLSLADQAASTYFGAVVNPATPGSAYNSLSTNQQKDIAQAKSLRLTQIGLLWNRFNPAPYKALQPTWVVSPQYKVNDHELAYFTYQRGEKGGISQIVNSVSTAVEPEKVNSFELGVKTNFFNKTLLLNADLFLMNITDYQQAVQLENVYQTNLNNASGIPGISYTSATGNVPRVQSKGFEFDGFYSGVEYTTLRFSGAWNESVYKEFYNSAQPVEYDNVAANYPAGSAPTPYRNVSGSTLPGAPRWSLNTGVDNRYPIPAFIPILGNQELHTAANISYTSRWNQDTALSSYAWIPANSITDASVGISNRQHTFEAALLVKNLTNNQVHTTQTWNSYSPAFPRFWYVTFTGKLL
jgi:iron complex outermembrane recepter protein